MNLKRMTLGKSLIAFLVCFVFSLNGRGQVNQFTGWFASFNTIKLNSKFSLHAELQVRSTNKWEHIQTILPRVGLNYHVTPNQILTAGYAYIPNRSAIGNYNALLSEHRIFQQYIITHKALAATVAHRFRLEERFIPKAVLKNQAVEKDGHLYTTRLRYFIRAVLPLNKQKPFTKGPFVALQNELFVNISNTENVNGQFFDQNRLYGAVGYRICKKLDIEMGYLMQYVNRRPLVGSASNNDIMNNVLQLAIYSRL